MDKAGECPSRSSTSTIDFFQNHFSDPFRIRQHLRRVPQERSSPDRAVVVNRLAAVRIDDILAIDIPDDMQVSDV